MSEGSRSSMDSKTSSTPDYYDIPKHLLPSSNFANRPASDISMLDGTLFESMPDAFELSTHIDDASDSESEAEASTKNIEWTLSRPDRDIDAQPHITITAPQEKSSAAQSQVELRERSVPANAPAVASASSSTSQPIVLEAPPPPRKRASSFGFKRSRSAHNMESLMQPQQAEQARPRSSSGVRKIFRREEVKPEQETTSSKGKGKLIEKEKKILRKARSAEKPVQLPKGKAKVVVQDDKLVDAFAQKAKEQKSLLQRKLDMLVMDNEEGENKTKRSDLHQRSHSAGMDTEEFEAKILPSRPRTSSGVESRGRIPSLSESTTASESSLEQDEKAEEDSCAAKRRIYLPGRINVEQPSPKFSREARSPSEWLQPVRLSLMRQSQRTSDLDGIVMFFEEFGVMEDVTEESFDKYWLDENQRIHNDAPSSGAKKPRSVEELGYARGQRAQRPSTPKLSSETTRSAESTPQCDTRGRQRVTLKSLLSPGLPGSSKS